MSRFARTRVYLRTNDGLKWLQMITQPLYSCLATVECLLLVDAISTDHVLTTGMDHCIESMGLASGWNGWLLMRVGILIQFWNHSWLKFGFILVNLEQFRAKIVHIKEKLCLWSFCTATRIYVNISIFITGTGQPILVCLDWLLRPILRFLKA